MAGPSSSAAGVVRPFRGRIVREKFAPGHVSPMYDALAPGRAVDAVRTPSVVDPEAYATTAPGLFVYRLRRGDEEHVGVVGDVHAEAFVDGRVRGHEAVQPPRVEALVEHFTAALARSELVALLHRPGQAEQAAIAESLHGEPVTRFTGPDGWEQTVWRVSEHRRDALTEELGAATYYIADGHHRVAAGLKVWQQAGRPADGGVLCAIYPFGGLRLLAFHRRVVGPVDRDAVLDLLADGFAVRPEHDRGHVGSFRMYLDGRWHSVDYTDSRSPGVGGLDVAILDERVLRPLLGAERSARLETTPALTSLDGLAKACDEDGGVLFALRPPPLEQLLEIADRGEVMPPKTTYFDPKPYAGIFLR